MTKSKRRTETVDQDHPAAKREKLASNNETLERRVLRSKYLQVLSKINDEREDLSRFDSGKFSSIFNEVENLHLLVQKPREQVADAEAFLEVANALVTSVQSQSNEGVTAADFVNCLISEFGNNDGRLDSQLSMDWRKIGLAVSPALSICHGLCTMVGPMNTEVKTRKAAVRRKRERPTQTVRPEELDDAEKEEKTDTDKNMKTMFEILRKKKRVKLESLILNRKSFAQTTENLFALSFLVKDGRVEISVNENGSHFVVPRNAPASEAVMSGKVVYNHFVFRFDFKDWKSMMEAVPADEELMPHRSASYTYGFSEGEPDMNNSQATLNTTPIRKLSRNRGLVIQEESVVEESPETGGGNKPSAFLRGKRKIN